MNKKKNDEQHKKNDKLDDKQLSKALEAENAELKEQLARERADAANVRRRAETEKLQMASFYKAHVLTELLPVIDNFERALLNIPQDLQSNDYVKGIESTIRQFQTTISKLGLEKIATVGAEFDPEFHEAISHEEGDGDTELVSAEVQSGYKLGDQVLRPAMVRVKS